MQLRAVVAAFALCASTLAGEIFKIDSSADISGHKRVFIVEFDHPDPATTYTAERVQQIHDAPHVAFEQYLRERGVKDAHIRFRFTDPRFVLATSVELASDSDPSFLLGFSGARRVREAQQYKLTARLPAGSGQMRYERARIEAVGPLQSRAADPSTVDTLDSHRLIGLDKVFAEGFYGQGQTVASIDTGIDYTHHALNGGKPDGQPCFGVGCPVKGGWAYYVDDDGTLQATSDPFDPCDGHGTTTAGMVIANAPDRNFTGSSPKADLLAYRVFGCLSDPSEDQIAAALQHAFLDGADVITMSIFYRGAYVEDSLLARMIPQLNALGVASVTGPGNDGFRGMFFDGKPAAASQITSAGSIQAPTLVAQTVSLLSSDGKVVGSVSYVSAMPIVVTPSVWPIYVFPNNACEPLPADTPELSNVVVLIPQVDYFVCGPYTQIDNLQSKGATIIFFHNDGTEPVYSPHTNITVTILSADGDRIVDLVHQGINVSVDFSTASLTALSAGHWAGKWNPWSGMGPTWELRPTVTLLGVGGGPISTARVADGLYKVGDGVSYSGPMVAGLYAVFRSAKGKHVDPTEMRQVLATTATVLIEDGTSGVPNSVLSQGNGLANIYNAVKSITRLWPDILNLNDTQNFNGTQTLQIKNIGQQTQHYTASHTAAGTLHPFIDARIGVSEQGLVQSVPGEQASVQIVPPTFSLQSGQVQSITVVVTPPSPNQVNVPCYSGFVNITSDKEFGSVHAAYFGVAADFKAVPIFNQTAPPPLFDASHAAVTGPDQILTVSNSSSVPSVVTHFFTATRLAVIDLVSANATVDSMDPASPPQVRPPYIVGHAARINTLTNWPRNIASEPGPRSRIYPTWTDFQNVTRPIESGHYRILVRGLKHFGDLADPADYEAHVSLPFHLVVNIDHASP